MVQVYAPDTTYDVNNDDRGDYSQELGRKAETIVGGVTNEKWSIGEKLKKPSNNMIEHPKRLLFNDLRLHLAHYALDPHCTLVLMGDFNVDLHRSGPDVEALRKLSDELGLISAAEARWPRSYDTFKTHKGNDTCPASHIDHTFITKQSSMHVRKFGIDDDANLMHDFDHAIMFTDLDVAATLGLSSGNKAPKFENRRKSTIRYSDKKQLERFRPFAENLFKELKLDDYMERLIGSIKLDDNLKIKGAQEIKTDEQLGWEAVHWRKNPNGSGSDYPDKAHSAPDEPVDATCVSRRDRVASILKRTPTAANECSDACPAGGNTASCDNDLRTVLSAALTALDEVASLADESFAETHGGQTRQVRKSNVNRVGAGLSAKTANAAEQCIKFRRIIKHLLQDDWAAAVTLRDELHNDD